MSSVRRHENPGRRERLAGKRRRRGISYHYDPASGWGSFKVGSRHSRRLAAQVMAVADGSIGSEPKTVGQAGVTEPPD